MSSPQLRAIFLRSMIWSLALTALIGVAAIVYPPIAAGWRVLLSTLTFGLFSMVAMGCAMVMERGRLVRLMWAGLACAALAMVSWLAAIWFPSMWRRGGDVLVQCGGTFTVAGVAIAHVGRLALYRFDQRNMEAVRVGTMATATALGAAIVTLMWFYDAIEGVIDEDIIFRGLGVMGVLAACGSVVTPILSRVQGLDRRGSGESMPPRVSIELVCPRCSARQTMPAGPSHCATCRLRITIEVEEPRCVCGYLLYRLESERCPECGARVDRQHAKAA
jgi:hypothetical protein